MWIIFFSVFNYSAIGLKDLNTKRHRIKFKDISSWMSWKRDYTYAEVKLRGKVIWVFIWKGREQIILVDMEIISATVPNFVLKLKKLL
jgi:hypothetical protein